MTTHQPRARHSVAAGNRARVCTGCTTPHTRTMDLLNGLRLDTWDGAKRSNFMTIRDKDFGAPAAPIRGRPSGSPGGDFPCHDRAKGRRPTPSTGTASSPPP